MIDWHHIADMPSQCLGWACDSYNFVSFKASSDSIPRVHAMAVDGDF